MPSNKIHKNHVSVSGLKAPNTPLENVEMDHIIPTCKFDGMFINDFQCPNPDCKLNQDQLLFKHALRFYKSLYLMHTVGSGKTLCMVILIDEILKRFADPHSDDECPYVVLIMKGNQFKDFSTNMRMYNGNFNMSGLIVTTYIKFASVYEQYYAKDPSKLKAVIVDEFHKFSYNILMKNEAKTTKNNYSSLLTLLFGLDHNTIKMALTATPMINTTNDIKVLRQFLMGSGPYTDDDIVLDDDINVYLDQADNADTLCKINMFYRKKFKIHKTNMQYIGDNLPALTHANMITNCDYIGIFGNQVPVKYPDIINKEVPKPEYYSITNILKSNPKFLNAGEKENVEKYLTTHKETTINNEDDDDQIYIQGYNNVDYYKYIKDLNYINLMTNHSHKGRYQAPRAFHKQSTFEKNNVIRYKYQDLFYGLIKYNITDNFVGTHRTLYKQKITVEISNSDCVFRTSEGNDYLVRFNGTNDEIYRLESAFSIDIGLYDFFKIVNKENDLICNNSGENVRDNLHETNHENDYNKYHVDYNETDYKYHIENNNNFENNDHTENYNNEKIYYNSTNNHHSYNTIENYLDEDPYKYVKGLERGTNDLLEGLGYFEDYESPEITQILSRVLCANQIENRAESDGMRVVDNKLTGPNLKCSVTSIHKIDAFANKERIESLISLNPKALYNTPRNYQFIIDLLKIYKIDNAYIVRTVYRLLYIAYQIKQFSPVFSYWLIQIAISYCDPGLTIIYFDNHLTELRKFARLLELGGFNRIEKASNLNQGYANYLELSGNVGYKPKELYDINHKNWDGSKIKVVLYTQAYKEGISMLNVLRIFSVLTWNKTSQTQSIGRGLRFNSYDQMKNEPIPNKYKKNGKITPIIEVTMSKDTYCSNKMKESFDTKDRDIQVIMDILNDKRLRIKENISVPDYLIFNLNPVKCLNLNDPRLLRIDSKLNPVKIKDTRENISLRFAYMINTYQKCVAEINHLNTLLARNKLVSSDRSNKYVYELNENFYTQTIREIHKILHEYNYADKPKPYQIYSDKIKVEEIYKEDKSIEEEKSKYESRLKTLENDLKEILETQEYMIVKFALRSRCVACNKQISKVHSNLNNLHTHKHCYMHGINEELYNYGIIFKSELSEPHNITHVMTNLPENSIKYILDYAEEINTVLPRYLIDEYIKMHDEIERIERNPQFVLCRNFQNLNCKWPIAINDKFKPVKLTLEDILNEKYKQTNIHAIDCACKA